MGTRDRDSNDYGLPEESEDLGQRRRRLISGFDDGPFVDRALTLAMKFQKMARRSHAVMLQWIMSNVAISLILFFALTARYVEFGVSVILAAVNVLFGLFSIWVNVTREQRRDNYRDAASMLTDLASFGEYYLQNEAGAPGIRTLLDREPDLETAEMIISRLSDFFRMNQRISTPGRSLDLNK